MVVAVLTSGASVVSLAMLVGGSAEPSVGATDGPTVDSVDDEDVLLLEHPAPINAAASAPAIQRRELFQSTIADPQRLSSRRPLCHTPPRDHLPDLALSDLVTQW